MMWAGLVPMMSEEGVRVLDPLELEVLMVVHHHVSARK